MKYKKIFSGIEAQINILESRGMFFEDKKIASFYLNNISYYRLIQVAS
jgi:abortive infection bacteriophage resistance protein